MLLVRRPSFKYERWPEGCLLTSTARTFPPWVTPLRLTTWISQNLIAALLKSRETFKVAHIF